MPASPLLAYNRGVALYRQGQVIRLVSHLPPRWTPTIRNWLPKPLSILATATTRPPFNSRKLIGSSPSNRCKPQSPTIEVALQSNPADTDSQDQYRTRSAADQQTAEGATTADQQQQDQQQQDQQQQDQQTAESTTAELGRTAGSTVNHLIRQEGKSGEENSDESKSDENQQQNQQEQVRRIQIRRIKIRSIESGSFRQPGRTRIRRLKIRRVKSDEPKPDKPIRNSDGDQKSTTRTITGTATPDNLPSTPIRGTGASTGSLNPERSTTATTTEPQPGQQTPAGQVQQAQQAAATAPRLCGQPTRRTR